MKGSRAFSTKTSIPAGLDELWNLRLKNTHDTNFVNTNILSVVSNTEVLFAAYHKIKSSPGNMTKEVDEETLDGINTK